MRLKFKIRLTESQKEAYEAAHDGKIKYITLPWSRQSGKSTLMQVLGTEWLFSPDESVAYVAKNFIFAKRAFKNLVKILPKEYVNSQNASDLLIEMKNGSSIQFFSAESGSSLRGFTFTRMVLDEFAFFKLELTDGSNLWWDVLFPTIKRKGKTVIFVSTPLGKDNLFYEMYMRGLSARTDYRGYKSILKTIYDDGLVSEEEIQDIKKNIPELTFRQEFMCEFLDSAITALPGFEKCFGKHGEAQKGDKVWCGIDLSTVGEDDTIVTFVSDAWKVAQFNMKGSLDMKYNTIAKLVNEWKPVGTYVEMNSIGEPMYNEIRKKVRDKSKLHEWTTTNSTKNDAISRLQTLISQCLLRLDESNTDLRFQMGVFTYTITKARNITYAAKPPHHDDRVMSLAIALAARDDFKWLPSKEKYKIDVIPYPVIN